MSQDAPGESRGGAPERLGLRLRAWLSMGWRRVRVCGAALQAAGHGWLG